MQVYEYLGYNPVEWSFDICMDFKRKDERLLINEIHHKYCNKKYFVIEYRDFIIFNNFIKKEYFIDNKDDYRKMIKYCIDIIYSVEMKVEMYKYVLFKMENP